MHNERYDLAVIGSGPVGQKAAIAAAKLGKRVAMVDRTAMLGGVSLHRGTIPSKTLRESVLHLTGLRHRAFFGRDYLASGKSVGGDRLLYAARRQPNPDRLPLEAPGLEADGRGRLAVNEGFQTDVPHIYAAGDVIGPPALASTAMEQGRLASCHMFGVPCKNVPELLPFGIYSIPEISFVGRTERQLTEQKVPYEAGVARFEEVARAQIVGDRVGLLKLLFDPDSLQGLGVPVIGESAAELVNMGLAVMVEGGTVESLRDTVFNYPTMAEVYKVAAMDGLNRIRHTPRISKDEG